MPSSTDIADIDLRARAESLIGSNVTELAGVEGGANNRIYRVSAGRARYAMKVYPCGGADTRDRLGSETAALRFLTRNGLTTVPGVVAVDAAHRIGVYEWIEGDPVGVARDSDVSAAAALLSQLHALRGADAAVQLPLASEACLSGAELVTQIERRAHRLREVAGAAASLTELLSGVAPLLAAARTGAERRYADAGLDFEALLDRDRRSLSPSDFGFHNARRKADGSLVFYDFEYFGWDDPVKPVADFVLHPGMTMTESQRRGFVAEAGVIYGSDRTYAIRLRALFPLHALRWTLILCNEFLPERWARRVQAGATVDRATALARQAAKAKAMLETARTSLAAFPYGD
jgi:hypothetical protein